MRDDEQMIGAPGDPSGHPGAEGEPGEWEGGDAEPLAGYEQPSDDELSDDAREHLAEEAPSPVDAPTDES